MSKVGRHNEQELLQMAGSEHRQELLASGASSQKDLVEDFDYIFVFTNPFAQKVKSKLAKLMERTYTKEWAQTFVLQVFRTQVEPLTEEPQYIKDIRDTLKTFLDGCGEEITREKLGIFVIGLVTDIMQNHLHLELKMFSSRDSDEIFVKIRTNENNMAVVADLNDYHLQFKKLDRINQKDFQRFPPFGPYEKNKKLPGEENALENSLTTGLFKKIGDKEQYFKRYDTRGNETNGVGSLFRFIDRIRILNTMILDCIDTSELEKEKFLLLSYPMHDKDDLDVLKRDWSSCRNSFKRQPLNLVRNYFGERIALYFGWVQMYIQWLFIPGIIGLILFIIMASTGGYNDDSSSLNATETSILLYGIIICLASTFFDQLWVRQEKFYAWEWGMFNFRGQEHQRPEFDGLLGKDPVTGKIKKNSTMTRQWQRFRHIVSYSVICLFVGIVIAWVAGVFLYRSTQHGAWGLRFASFLNALQIKVMNVIYGKVAKWMNDWENYETDTIYNDQLSIKLFLFQFVNSYNSLFYIAFFKASAEGCEDDNCTYELQTQLGVIFITNLALNAMELGLPFLKNRYAQWRELKTLRQLQEDHPDRNVRIEESYTEEQSKLGLYADPMSDYMELVIQYGYVVLFSSVFPLTPIMAYVLNIFEVRVDSAKLWFLTRRPYPEGTEDMGIWYKIIVSISYIGVVSNSALICFTAGVFDDGLDKKWLAFLIIEHALFVLKYLISAYIPDMPTLVANGKTWSERVVDEKIYLKLSDQVQERKAKNLHFEQTEGARFAEFKKDQIPSENY